MEPATSLQPYEGPPDFTDAEVLFLHHYSQSLDRVAAMRTSGLALGCGARQDDDTLELVASGVLRKAERLPVAELASALGADRVAFLTRLWQVCNSPEPHQAIKGLQLMGRVHGLWDDAKLRGKTPVQIIVQQPAAKASEQSGLPFTLEPPKPA